MSALQPSFGDLRRFDAPRRVILYTPEGLFELPISYLARGRGLIGRRNPFQCMKYGDLSRDANPWSVFNRREVMHGAFRPDRPGSTVNSLVSLAEKALSGGVWVLTNDAADTGPHALATRQVLWCVKLIIDPVCSECVGHEFLMVVPRTRGLDAALEYVAHNSGGGWWGVYGFFAAQMMGSLRQTTSFFCPTQWPLARRVERLNYYEAVFAMSLRPEPLPTLRTEEGWLHAPESRPALEYDYELRFIGGSEPLASMASVNPRLLDSPPQDWLSRACDLPTLPDDILDRIFTIAAHRGLAGNTRGDWGSHLALRAANSFARDVVRRVSLGIVTKLQTGIASLTPSGATAAWSEVRTLREEALQANLHPIEFIMHGDGLDEWTIARIRLKKDVESHPRNHARWFARSKWLPALGSPGDFAPSGLRQQRCER